MAACNVCGCALGPFDTTGAETCIECVGKADMRTVVHVLRIHARQGRVSIHGWPVWNVRWRRKQLQVKFEAGLLSCWVSVTADEIQLEV